MKRLTALILVIAVFAMTACSIGAPKWQEHFDLGLRYLSDGNYEEAILEFTAILDIDPNVSDAYYYRANAYVMGAQDFASHSGNNYDIIKDYLDKAKVDYQEAAKIDPEKTDVITDKLDDLDKLRDEIAPETFFNKNGIVINGPEQGEPGDNKVNISVSSDATENSFSTEGQTKTYNYTVNSIVRVEHGPNGAPNLVEHLNIPVNVTVGEKLLSSDEDLESAAWSSWVNGRKWTDYGFGNDAANYPSLEYWNAYESYKAEHFSAEKGLKAISCTVSYGGIKYTEASRVDQNNTHMRLYLCMGAVDKYTGLSHVAAGPGYCSRSVAVGNRSYDLNFIYSMGGTQIYYPTGEVFGSHFQKDHRVEVTDVAINMTMVLTAIVPADYDGLVFLVGPDAEQDNSGESQSENLVDLERLPQYGLPETHYFSIY